MFDRSIALQADSRPGDGWQARRRDGARAQHHGELVRGAAHHDGKDPAASLHEAARYADATLAQMFSELPVRRRLMQPRQYVFEAGQPRQALFLVRGGCVKTTLNSADGREQITGFRMSGDVLGLDALDLPTYVCSAVALDIGQVWELPYALLRDATPQFQQAVTTMLAGEVRSDRRWMLAMGTLGADQRVATFLLDLAARMATLGFSARCLVLRMTRAEIGNYLTITLETVTRALGRLQSQGLIGVSGREIRIEDAGGLRASLHAGRCS